MNQITAIEPLKARIYFKTRFPLRDVAITIGFSNLEGRRLLSYDADLQQKMRKLCLDWESQCIAVSAGYL